MCRLNIVVFDSFEEDWGIMEGYAACGNKETQQTKLARSNPPIAILSQAHTQYHTIDLVYTGSPRLNITDSESGVGF